MVITGPLRSRNFRLLLTANVTSLAGSSVYYVAIPFAVLRIGGSASDVGYVAVARLIPSVAFLLVGGPVADRLPRQQVMVAANALQALAQGTAAGVLLTGHASVWLLAVLGAVAGAGSVCWVPWSPIAAWMVPVAGALSWLPMLRVPLWAEWPWSGTARSGCCWPRR